MQSVFIILAKAVQLYSFLCFFRIILSWIPNLMYTRIGQILCSITDPFLNIFRKLPLHIGMIDFSPMIAFLVLSLVNSALSGIARTGTFSVAEFIATTLILLWEIVSSILGFLIILVIIRLIVLIFTRNKIYYNSIWNSIDDFLSRTATRFTKIFTKNKYISYRTNLIIFLIELILVDLAGFFLMNILANLIVRIIPV